MKTSRKQILQSGVEKSMSSPEVFPASLFLAPDSERERKMTATSGRKCYERYGRFSPIGLLVKTLLESSQWYNPAVKLRWDVKNLCSERLTEKEYCIGRNTLSKQCVTTLNVKDISSNRLLFRLVPSERRTEETVSSLLPTVQTQGLKVCNENGKTTFYPVGLLPTPRAVEVVEHPMKAAARTKDRTGTKLNNLSSGAAFGLLPTPMASDATTGAIIGKNDQFVTTRNGTPRRINQNGQNGSVGLARMVRLLPTPNAREADKYSKKYNPNSQMGTALTAMAETADMVYHHTKSKVPALEWELQTKPPTLRGKFWTPQRIAKLAFPFHKHPDGSPMAGEEVFDRLWGEDVPAWSLCRLLELLPTEIRIGTSENVFGLHHETSDAWLLSYPYVKSFETASPVESCVLAIDWLIANGHFNKEYYNEENNVQ